MASNTDLTAQVECFLSDSWDLKHLFQHSHPNKYEDHEDQPQKEVPAVFIGSHMPSEWYEFI